MTSQNIDPSSWGTLYIHLDCQNIADICTMVSSVYVLHIPSCELGRKVSR